MMNRERIKRKQTLMRERGPRRYSPRQHTFKMIKGQRVCAACGLRYGRQLWHPCRPVDNGENISSNPQAFPQAQNPQLPLRARVINLSELSTSAVVSSLENTIEPLRNVS